MSGNATSVAERSFLANDVPYAREEELMDFLDKRPKLLELCRRGKVTEAAREIEKDPRHHAIASGLRNCAANWTN
jgi:hypothetical protein